MAILFILLLTAGCATTERVVKEERITIGVYTALSGEGAVIGKGVVRGIDLAASEVNGRGGVLSKKIVLDYQDSHLDPSAAVNIVRTFIDVKEYPLIISAEGSSPTVATAPLAEEAHRVLLVALASTPSLRDAGDYVFRIMPSDTLQGTEMARLCEEIGAERVAILHLDDTYGNGIREVFTAHFTENVAAESFETGAGDFKTQLEKLRQTRPEVLIVIARNEFPRIVKQMTELGISLPIIASDTVKDETLIAQTGGAAEGTRVIFPAKSDDEAFAARYRAAYGEEPNSYSQFGYDALMAVAKAIEAAGTTEPEKVKEALYATHFQGSSGLIAFDDHGELANSAFDVFRVENGSFVKAEN